MLLNGDGGDSQILVRLSLRTLVIDTLSELLPEFDLNDLLKRLCLRPGESTGLDHVVVLCREFLKLALVMSQMECGSKAISVMEFVFT